MKENLLEKVTIGFRCPMDWEQMGGDLRERFCEKCEKTVTDLSALTAAEAEAFLRRKGPRGKACVRILRDQKGRILTRGCGSRPVQAQAALQTTALAAVSSLATAACSSSVALDDSVCSLPPPVQYEDTTTDTQEVVRTLGVMCLPPEE